MDLQQLRQQIDGIDEQLVQLFCRRMEICGDVARYKKENGLPVLDSGRERSKVNALMQQADEPFEDSVASLYSLIFELSRSYQNKLLGSSSQLPAVIAKAIEDLEAMFAGEGRVLIRPSGTEPKVRVMIEGKDQKVIEQEAKKLADLIQNTML